MASTVINRITNIPRAIPQYIKESYAELRKVSWPSRETTIRYTIIVAASSIIVGLVIGGLDYVLALALERIVL